MFEVLPLISNIATPRFRARNFINKLNLSTKINESEVFQLLNEITKKDIILDYSQLRIGLLHYLNNTLPKDAKVATTSYTIYDMINIIINSGKKPFFVDINKDNLGPDLEQLKNLVIDKKVDCVIYTYLHGYKCDISNLAKVCKENKCILIEDCAQSLWSYECENCPGSFGDAALFSTGFFKNINTISGGLLCIKSESKFTNKIINSHKKLKNNFSKDFLNRFFYALFFKLITNKIFFAYFTFPVLRFGVQNNFEFINKRAREENNPKYIKRDQSYILRMNTLQKLLIMMQTKESIKKDFFKKAFIAESYLFDLKPFLEKGIIIIPGFKPQNNLAEFREISSYNQIPIICKDREKLLKFLVKNNIDIAAQTIRNLTDLEIYKNYIEKFSTNADYISKTLILLPCYPDYPYKTVKKITRLIIQFYSNIF